MKEVSPPAADVGVLVGRFQVHKLHEAHLELIRHVVKHHDRVMIFLGMSPCRVTRNNPLDFDARKAMIQDAFPDVSVYYVRDCRPDDLWSKRLDNMIYEHIKPGAKVLLYGGRDAFIKHYEGKIPTRELEQEVFISGTAVRNTIANTVPKTTDFRAGVIWASQNQYPRAIPTVDVAVWDETGEKLLLARKPDEDLYRFIGGFATGPTYESDARREVDEEAHIAITDPVYVGSHQVDDWRYRSEADKIVTLLFEAKRLSGNPRPDDDIAELKWFDFATLRDEMVVPEHRPLLKMLQCKRETHHEDEHRTGD
ncbi:hypothetical protein LCGC14_0164130 [marine sediment metagenome]|uniref:Nudix hydrolase domain-containing protein n=1 Tax=marine sediment metagenome TaxID=412755 RepID=A0A0F9UYI4_9ZZZZ